MFEDLFTAANAMAFFTLAALEIVLGVDNLVFLAILVGRLPAHKQRFARRLGLGAAALMRVGLLLVIDWIASLREPIMSFTIGTWTCDPSWRDIILIAGGLVLMAKAIGEIGHMVGEDESEPEPSKTKRAVATMSTVIAQVMVMDLVFSLDSVITAVGMADHLVVMIAAILTAVAVMMVCAGAVTEFVDRHPTVKMLALSFLVLIGFTLVIDGAGVHVPKGYIYFAMGFALAVEGLNIWKRKRAAC